MLEVVQIVAEISDQPDDEKSAEADEEDRQKLAGDIAGERVPQGVEKPAECGQEAQRHGDKRPEHVGVCLDIREVVELLPDGFLLRGADPEGQNRATEGKEQGNEDGRHGWLAREHAAGGGFVKIAGLVLGSAGCPWADGAA